TSTLHFFLAKMAIIKAELDGALRLAEISAEELDVSHVRRTLGNLFEIPNLEGFDLFYLDDNDEMILIDSDEEFLAGLCENGSPFRISVASHPLMDDGNLPIAAPVFLEDGKEDEGEEEDDD